MAIIHNGYVTEIKGEKMKNKKEEIRYTKPDSDYYKPREVLAIKYFGKNKQNMLIELADHIEYRIGDKTNFKDIHKNALSFGYELNLNVVEFNKCAMDILNGTYLVPDFPEILENLKMKT